ncbi:MAG TPA: hypothetical protein VM911_02365 [Pyrinomonadaceae bacterium]|nr:hypothetical protein [Pyrinomonadaceae bacterium]
MHKRKLILMLALVALLVFIAQQTPAQGRGPSTPEERAKALQLVHQLETDPLGKDAKEARRWLLVWLTDVPDISVTISPCYLEPLLGKDKNYGSDLFFQMTMSSAAFIIEHPDQAKDDVAVNKAGLEGTLRAYEAILKTKPKATWPLLDQLIERRNKGTLEDYVREISTTKKCKG